ncbi:hypothetical protein UFOVP448_55 [uncultured Caudovirales phage]|uniref:Uncharacterized protein n=1 Tax=uncultured Caudovirales phage TaxID=2100421 RepID=A0A6J5M7C8_9CAUD|nr:hypothetical protein UFOVP448_55 [uncultured Caudovirales phage]
MSSIQFQQDVARTIAPINDGTYGRIIPLDVDITVRHLLDLMRDANLQKRRIFYGREIRQEDCLEHEAFTRLHSRVSALPSETHSSGKGLFAKQIPGLPDDPEIRSRLDNLMNRYHAVLGLLSEIAELALLDSIVLQELLTCLYKDTSLSEFDSLVQDVEDSFHYTLQSLKGEKPSPPEDKGIGRDPQFEDRVVERDPQFEELADTLFYCAHHLLTSTNPTYKGRVSLSSLCLAVNAKLKVRYPNLFSPELSHEAVRDREAEMNAFYFTLDTDSHRNDLFLLNEVKFDATIKHEGVVGLGPVTLEDAEGRNIDDILSLPRPADPAN